MRISFDLPNELVQVVDTENRKGVPVTVLKMFGQTVLHYHGEGVQEGNWVQSNEDWEKHFSMLLSRHFAKLFLENEHVAENWSTESWTGRELRDQTEHIHYVRDDLD